MIDALRSYLQIASGIVEATATKAKDTATTLLSQGLEVPAADIGSQVSGIAEDLIEQGRTNRELLVGLVRTEIDRTVGRMGFVREEELAAVRKHVQRLEQELRSKSSQATELAAAAVGNTSAASSIVRDAAGKAAEAGAAVKQAVKKPAAAKKPAPSPRPRAKPGAEGPLGKTGESAEGGSGQSDD